jgi:hypothetical protein
VGTICILIILYDRMCSKGGCRDLGKQKFFFLDLIVQCQRSLKKLTNVWDNCLNQIFSYHIKSMRFAKVLMGPKRI